MSLEYFSIYIYSIYSIHDYLQLNTQFDDLLLGMAFFAIFAEDIMMLNGTNSAGKWFWASIRYTSPTYYELKPLMLNA